MNQIYKDLKENVTLAMKHADMSIVNFQEAKPLLFLFLKLERALRTLHFQKITYALHQLDLYTINQKHIWQLRYATIAYVEHYMSKISVWWRRDRDFGKSLTTVQYDTQHSFTDHIALIHMWMTYESNKRLQEKILGRELRHENA